MTISWLVQENVKNYPNIRAVEMKIIMLFMNFARMSYCFRKLQEATKVLSNLGLIRWQVVFSVFQSQAAKTYCLWNKFINNRVKEWDLPKFDADWKSFIAFVAEWSPNCQVWQLRMRVNFKILSKTLNSTSAHWWVLWEGIVGISILYPEYFYI